MTLAVVVALGCSSLSLAQDAHSELRVATFVLPPFVIKEGDRLTGFSIELWEEVAKRLNARSSYQLVTDGTAGIGLLRSNSVDIGVSGIFYSAELDKVMDFTYPILQAGLRVMVRESGQGVQLRPLRDWLTLLFSQSALLWLAAALAIIVVPAHVVWLLDRRNNDGVTPTSKYYPGIFHSMLWAGTALASQVQVMPRQWLARAFGLLWMFAGVVFVALYTAQLTALLTVAEIRGVINGPGDLPGKRVGTLAASTSAAYLQRIGADLQEFPSTDAMFQALLDGKVEAVVFGSPVLGYHATHEGRGRVKLVGPEIDKNEMGFVVPLNSPLRKRVSNQLLALHEDGTYQRIYAKWLGAD
jgi:polar amino acid transport system substrate-binding protein